MKEKIEKMREGVLYKNAGLFGYAAWPTVGRLSDGRLMATFSGGKDNARLSVRKDGCVLFVRRGQKLDFAVCGSRYAFRR